MPEEMLILEWYASAYHWTPDQVGRLPLEYAPWFPVVSQARSRADQIARDQKKPGR